MRKYKKVSASKPFPRNNSKQFSENGKMKKNWGETFYYCLNLKKIFNNVVARKKRISRLSNIYWKSLTLKISL